MDNIIAERFLKLVTDLQTELKKYTQIKLSW